MSSPWTVWTTSAPQRRHGCRSARTPSAARRAPARYIPSDVPDTTHDGLSNVPASTRTATATTRAAQCSRSTRSHPWQVLRVGSISPVTQTKASAKQARAIASLVERHRAGEARRPRGPLRTRAATIPPAAAARVWRMWADRRALPGRVRLRRRWADGRSTVRRRGHLGALVALR